MTGTGVYFLTYAITLVILSVLGVPTLLCIGGALIAGLWASGRYDQTTVEEK